MTMPSALRTHLIDLLTRANLTRHPMTDVDGYHAVAVDESAEAAALAADDICADPSLAVVELTEGEAGQNGMPFWSTSDLTAYVDHDGGRMYVGIDDDERNVGVLSLDPGPARDLAVALLAAARWAEESAGATK